MIDHETTEAREALDREDRKRRSAAAIDRIQALDDVERRVVLAYLCGWATEDVERALHVIFGDRAENHTGSTR